MIVSANRPYFAPFAGFFAKALRSDVMVVMDAVQFPRGTTWVTRNRFKNDQGTLWMTIPVWKKGLGLQSINEVKICHEGRWAGKHLAALKSAYANAPFFEEHVAFLEKLFTEKTENLLDFNLSVIRHLMTHLNMATRIVLMSELDLRSKEPLLSVEICRRLGASCFLAQSGAKKYLPVGAFDKIETNLKFFNPRPPVYPQLWGPFIPNLSVFDLLFNCGPRARKFLE
jgi:hypothetical protein